MAYKLFLISSLILFLKQFFMIYRCLGTSQVIFDPGQQRRSDATDYIYIYRRTPIKYIITFYLIVNSHTYITYFATSIPV